MGGDRQRLQKASRFLTRCFCTNANITRTHIKFDKRTETRTPVVALGERSSTAKVAGCWRIVTRTKDGETAVVEVRNIYAITEEKNLASE